MVKLISGLMALIFITALCGCATKQPPPRIQEAIGTMNACMPEYVAESNLALEGSRRRDAERLIGIGARLQEGMNALDRWARGKDVLEKDCKK